MRVLASFFKGSSPKSAIWFIIFLFSFSSASTQFFGQNKPRYRSFDFRIKSSDHFDIYYYLENREVLEDITRKSEQWYAMHQAVLRDTFTNKNPLVLYNNHPDFQQTNTINSAVGVGTGGVTEAFKNRVIFPMTFTNEQTNHVLGHEMVHAFQYHMILNGDSTSLQNFTNIPLWMVEGLAEYMSKGKEDPFTSMWMRSSVLNDDIPTFRDLQNPKYFPYRYGQAFWAFITSIYGDEIIQPLFVSTAKYGFEQAVVLELGTDHKSLEELWAKALRERFEPLMAGNTLSVGENILNKSNAGNMNVSPSLSPNGRYVTFWSEKELLSTNLYMAEAKDGRIVRKLSTDQGDGHLDAINFLEASGTWSGNSKKFAFVAVDKGRNIIVIKDVDSGKTLESFPIKGIPAFTNLAWNPKSNEIVFTGLVEGQVDLYVLDLRNKKTRRLTDDPYSEIQANFNEDGTLLSYATDQKSMTEGRIYGHYSMDIAVMDLASETSEIYPLFPGADNLNPNFDHEGNIIFLSNRDGFRNLYKYYPRTEKLEQLTNLKTGVSGITDLSPAVSVSTRRDRMVFSTFNNFEYDIQNVRYEDLRPFEVDKNDVDFNAGTLVDSNPGVTDAVNKNLKNQDRILENKQDIILLDKKYKPKFQLDFIGGGAGVGVGNNTFGNNVGLAGGIQLLFSDQLGNHQIFSNLALNGELFDAGGQVSYLNRKNRIAWGIGVGHIPLRTGFAEPIQQVLLETQTGPIPALRQDVNVIRVFNESLNLFAHFPFSRTLRIEGGITGGYQSFRWDEYQNIYIDRGFQNFELVQRNRERIETGETIQFDQFYTLERGFQTSLNVALVGDNSTFGMTSPLRGHRFRIGAEQHFGINNYTAFIADARKYFWLKPFSFAVRGTAFNRLDLSDDNNVYPFFIGQQGFVRGYGSAFGNFQVVAQRLEEQGISFGQLIGSNMALASGEVRLPFTGPRRLAVIPTNLLLSDLLLFYDVGVAYNAFSDFSSATRPYVTTSAGVGARINVFGALIAEPYYAYLFRENRFTFGFNLIPGW